jgi:hypothetical protein
MTTRSVDSRNSQRALLAAIGLVLALSAAFGCAGTSVVAKYDKWAAFDRYDSYSIQPGTVRNDGSIVGGPNQLVQNRIDGALGSQLSARGLAPADRNSADLIVTYAASEGTRQELVRGRTGPLTDSTYAGRAIWVQEYREALLVIEVIDNEKQLVVWRAIARGMNEKLIDPVFIKDAVGMALAQFPRGASPPMPLPRGPSAAEQEPGG